MFPSAVIKHFDIVDHVIFGVLPGVIVAMGCPLSLSTAKETLRHRVVQTLALPAHTTAEPMARQESLGGMTRLLTPPIYPARQPRGRLPPPQCHL